MNYIGHISRDLAALSIDNTFAGDADILLVPG